MDIAVEMQNIVKKFGDFVANDGINLTVKKGEVHAILGENGAGKSTLMNILYGLYHPTSGKIFIDGKEIVIGTPQRAIDLGIVWYISILCLYRPLLLRKILHLAWRTLRVLYWI